VEHISIIPDTLFYIGGLPVTNTMLSAWTSMALLSLFAFTVYAGLKFLPGKLQNAAEIVVEQLLSFFENIAGSREAAERFFPIVGTIFIFILTSNWLGIIPGVGSIGIHEGDAFIPFFRSTYSDINMTLALALVAVVLSHLYGLYTVGVKHHIGKFVSFKSPLAFYTGVLEIISEVAKIISLSFRLFGNVFAGEVLLIIVGSLVPYIATVPFLGMELFVGFIQAAIFAVLAMVAFSAFTRAEAH